MEVATTGSPEVAAATGFPGNPATSGKGSGPSFSSVLEAASDRRQAADGGTATEESDSPGASIDSDADGPDKPSSEQPADQSVGAAVAMMVSPPMVAPAAEVVPVAGKVQGDEDPTTISTVAAVQADGVATTRLASGATTTSSPSLPVESAGQRDRSLPAVDTSGQGASAVSSNPSEAVAAEAGEGRWPRTDGGGRGRENAAPISQQGGSPTLVAQYQASIEPVAQDGTVERSTIPGGDAPVNPGEGTKATNGVSAGPGDQKGASAIGDAARTATDPSGASAVATVASEPKAPGTPGESIAAEGTSGDVPRGVGGPAVTTSNSPGDTASQGSDRGSGTVAAGRVGRPTGSDRGEDFSSRGQDPKGTEAPKQSATSGPSTATVVGGSQGQAQEPAQAASGKSEERSDARVESIAATRSGEAGSGNVASAGESGRSEKPQDLESGLFDQLMAHAAKLAVPRNSSLRVQLKPESLGYLDLRLGLRDGVLTLQILAGSERTRDMIQGALPQLRQALEGKAIEVGQMSLGTPMGGSDGWQNGFAASSGAGQWLGGRRYPAVGPQPSSATEPLAAPTQPQPAGGDALGGRHLVDYRV